VNAVTTEECSDKNLDFFVIHVAKTPLFTYYIPTITPTKSPTNNCSRIVPMNIKVAYHSPPESFLLKS
jgi:hypothetical protein